MQKGDRTTCIDGNHEFATADDDRLKQDWSDDVQIISDNEEQRDDIVYML